VAVSETMISLRGVSKTFDGSGEAAVTDLSMDIGRGETVVLVGPSGCGKTTTMKMINRLIEPTSGTIEVDGRSVRDQDPVALRRGIGYVIQSIGLLPHRTVEENIATVPRLEGWDRPRIEERVRELIDVFELDPAMLPRYPSELSGGQRQRVGVARALAVDPPVMLMDEPFGALDPLTRDALGTDYRALHDKLSLTTVMVTHDMAEAVLLADRIVVLKAGRIVADGPPATLLAETEDPDVRALLERLRERFAS
jgi:osmoprotectant transport system ATP-binding protein